MVIENVEILKTNCREFARTGKSIDVLRMADGKNHYTEIAKLTGLHKTKVSGLLRKAEKLSLARKVKTGVYKKIPGVLGFMPQKNNSKITAHKTVKNLAQKIMREKTIPKPEFPVSLVIKSEISASLDKMVIAYQSLYAVENSLRELIRAVFSNENNWWGKYVPLGVRTAVQKNIDDMPYHASKRRDELEYTHLGQLKEVIINGKNWCSFLPYLKTSDKSDFSATINKAIASRNAIGHCIPLKPKDLKIVDVRLRDILEMIK